MYGSLQVDVCFMTVSERTRLKRCSWIGESVCKPSKKIKQKIAPQRESTQVTHNTGITEVYSYDGEEI